MGGRNSRFFHELTPLANAIGRACAPKRPVPETFDQACERGLREEAAARAKRAEKLARRAARAGHGVKA